jgi:hypothetical protein
MRKPQPPTEHLRRRRPRLIEDTLLPATMMHSATAAHANWALGSCIGGRDDQCSSPPSVSASHKDVAARATAHAAEYSEAAIAQHASTAGTAPNTHAGQAPPRPCRIRRTLHRRPPQLCRRQSVGATSTGDAPGTLDQIDLEH